MSVCVAEEEDDISHQLYRRRSSRIRMIRRSRRRRRRRRRRKRRRRRRSERRSSISVSHHYKLADVLAVRFPNDGRAQRLMLGPDADGGQQQQRCRGHRGGPPTFREAREHYGPRGWEQPILISAPAPIRASYCVIFRS